MVLVAVVVAAAGALPCHALAEGSQGSQERAARKYAGCVWTQDMGRFLFECVRQHNGMNAQWCHIEAMETFCGGGAGEQDGSAGGTAPR
jgi:hypothetical protein